jgi:predicted metal-dependent HD superfamily phosphohydrolase
MLFDIITEPEEKKAFIACYEEPHRRYHTLAHLEALWQLLQTYRSSLLDPELLQYAIIFHDIIYNVESNDNEDLSAGLAAAYLYNIGYDPAKRTKVMQYIIATKTHVNPLGETDLDYFLDFDLGILSAPASAYDLYAKQIREEYQIYPDKVYIPGRKKVLQHFLAMPAIYKTTTFKEEREKLAKENMQRELDGL